MQDKDLKYLARFTRELAEKIKVGARELPKEVANELVETLINVTPVDTSKALSNWMATLNKPSTSEIGPYFDGDKGSTAKQSSMAAIDAADSNISGRKTSQDIYIVNNVDYIEELNDGSSKQAPAGFIENSILSSKKMIKYSELIKDRQKVK